MINSKGEIVTGYVGDYIKVTRSSYKHIATALKECDVIGYDSDTNKVYSTTKKHLNVGDRFELSQSHTVWSSVTFVVL